MQTYPIFLSVQSLDIKADLYLVHWERERVGIAAMVGRLHFYEGHDMRHITLPIRVFHLLGIKTLIGSTRPILNADLQLQMLQEV